MTGKSLAAVFMYPPCPRDWYQHIDSPKN